MIFDTDVLIWFSRTNSAAVHLIHSEVDRIISIVSLMELVRGVRQKAEIGTIRRFLIDAEFEVLPITKEISYTAAALIESHAHSDGLQITDALIAATAREHGLVLATGNVRHFRAIAGVELKTFRPT